MSYQLIETTVQLDDYLQGIPQDGVIAVDTEFVRETTLYPELGLVQLNDGQQVALVDPLAVEDLQPLWQLMADHGITKVLHAAGEDLDIFLAHGQPQHLFDTQLALAFIGENPSLGYAAMVARYQGVSLDKSACRTNWLARPLSARQCAYAADDVRYLLPAYQQIAEQLEQWGRTVWLEQEMALQIRRRQRQPAPQHRYLALKECWRLKPHQLAVLRELVIWRQQQAERRNKAVNFIARGSQLMAIARSCPLTHRQLSDVEGLPEWLLRRYGKQLLACVKQGLEHQPPPAVKRLDTLREYKVLFEQIRQKVADSARHTGMEASFIGSRKQINEYLVWLLGHPQRHLLAGDKPDLVVGWRHQLLALEDIPRHTPD